MFDFRSSPASAAGFRSRLGRHTYRGAFSHDFNLEHRDAATVGTSVGWTIMDILSGEFPASSHVRFE